MNDEELSGTGGGARPRHAPRSSARGTVDVWRASLPAEPHPAKSLVRSLSPDELARAERIRNPIERARFTSARATLRTLLGTYTGLPAASLRIGYSPHGKPMLLDVPDLHFSVSHAAGWALFAVSTTSRVGVDLEWIRELGHPEKIARRVFSPAELESWLALDADERTDGFFERWTRMEALAKLLGVGVWGLCAAPVEPAAAGIAFHSLPLPDGYSGCVAVVADARVEVRDLDV